MDIPLGRSPNAQVSQGTFDDERPAIDLHRHLALFRRRFRLFASIAAVVFIAVLVITFSLPKKYTGTAEVMLDPRQQTVSGIQGVLSGIPPTDTTAVDTEVEVLKSRSLAEKVVANLQLEKDPEFNASLKPKFFLASLFPRKSSDSPLVQKERAHSRVVDRVIKSLSVSRSGLTNVIRVHFESQSAEKAAFIANNFASNYLLLQLDARFEATKRASDWLNDRLSTLKQQVEGAEAAVARYKAVHGLMGITSSEGATIAQQEISTISTQLATAKAEQAEAEAKLGTARQQIARGSNGEDLGAALDSPVINQLRSQRAQISGEVADMAGRLGPRHPDMLKAQRQLADLDEQIQSEVKRITSNLESQVSVARQRTSSIEGSLQHSQGSLADNGTASVELNNLQRNADSLSTLYQTYLDRFKQTSNQQGMEQSDSRIVSSAKIPSLPSFPNIPLNIGIAFILALASAVATMFLVEALESGLYTSEDVEKLIGLPHVGSVPLASSVINNDDRRGRRAGNLSPINYVVEKPLSSFAEAFRNLRTSIAFSRVGETVKVVAVTSALPGEGKTTTCICLGRVTALGGAKTVIVDCDLRRRTVNRLFKTEPTVGLLEVLNGNVSLQDALIFDDVSGAYFLPLSQSSYTPRDVFASPAMDRLLERLRNDFDFILLDTAPVLPVVDTRVLAPKADATIFLAQWRKTPRKAVEAAVKLLESVGANVVGLALTQVDMKEQARSGYGDAGYYYRSYSKYYSSEAA